MLDHIVYAHPHPESFARDFYETTGVRPVFGGAHPGRGTLNYLAGLENGAYFEILGPDPEQSVAPEKTMFRVGELGPEFEPRVLTWAWRVADLDATATAGRERDIDFAHPVDAGRTTPVGRELQWRFAVREPLPFDGLQPFLIDWGSSPHPSEGLESGIRLVEMRAYHPEAEGLRMVFDFLGTNLEVIQGRAHLEVTLATPKGQVTL